MSKSTDLIFLQRLISSMKTHRIFKCQWTRMCVRVFIIESCHVFCLLVPRLRVGCCSVGRRIHWALIEQWHLSLWSSCMQIKPASCLPPHGSCWCAFQLADRRRCIWVAGQPRENPRLAHPSRHFNQTEQIKTNIRIFFNSYNLKIKYLMRVARFLRSRNLLGMPSAHRNRPKRICDEQVSGPNLY